MADILDCLAGASSVIIAGHTRPDGDCVGSCMGMYHYIRSNYPDIEVNVRLEEVPESYAVIPGTENVITEYADDKSYDVFISLDASDKARLAGAIKYFDTAGHTICIDHHISNEGFADENYIVPDASSTSEVLCDIFDHSRISYDAAMALYVGIICDSGVFKYSCTGSHTMETAGMLMDKGIPYTELVDSVFYEKSFVMNRIMGYCLLNSRLSCEGKMISCYLDDDTMKSYGAVHSDLEGIVSQMKLTRGTEISLFISDSGSGGLRISMRSSGKVDVRKIAGIYGGGGHTLASGASASGDPLEIIAQIEAMVKEQLS